MPPATCVRVAGIISEADARELAEGARRSGAILAYSGSTTFEQHRFWVLIPPFPSANAAQPTLETLRRRGLRDYYLIRTGENRNAISLGVFSGREAAESRYRRIERLGLEPRLERITLPALVYWVEAAWSEPDGQSEWRETVGAQGYDAEAVRCARTPS